MKRYRQKTGIRLKFLGEVLRATISCWGCCFCCVRSCICCTCLWLTPLLSTTISLTTKTHQATSKRALQIWAIRKHTVSVSPWLQTDPLLFIVQRDTLTSLLVGACIRMLKTKDNASEIQMAFATSFSMTPRLIESSINTARKNKIVLFMTLTSLSWKVPTWLIAIEHLRAFMLSTHANSLRPNLNKRRQIRALSCQLRFSLLSSLYSFWCWPDTELAKLKTI